MKYKILIISNAAMNQTDSNGRNISRLLDSIPYDNKAEFFVYGTPDYNECGNFYCVSDSMALSSFVSRKKINGRVNKEKVLSFDKEPSNKKISKTPLNMLIREFVWKYGCWYNNFLDSWIDEINPSCLIVVAGDNCFTIDLARRISKKRNIPVILYSTEEYPFKKYNYVTKRPSLFYEIWRFKLRKAYMKLSKYISCGVFNTESLSKLYEKEYNYLCYSIYQKSNIDYKENYKLSNDIVVSYLGNLGLNRHKALIEIANVLEQITPGAKLDIYGNPNDSIRQELESCKNINLKGFISYDDVVSVIHKSTLLVHSEYNDDFYNRDLKYAFSTKITDSVSSGTPFLIYAPNELEETRFLREKKCAFVASSKEELVEVMTQALFSEKIRKEILENAKIVRSRYFIKDNKMKKIIEEIINESNTN